jgi:TolA-binding protein
MKHIYSTLLRASLGIVFSIATSSCTFQLAEDVDRLNEAVSDLRSLNAEHSSRTSSLQSEVRALQGKLEELEYSQQKRIGGEVSALKSELTTLRKRVPPPAVVPLGQLEQDEVGAQSMPDGLRERFISALSFIREGRFDEALPLLQAALDAGEGNSATPTILFWLGVAYDGTKDSRNALIAYNQIISVFPQNTLVPSALLRQAGVFKRVNDQKAEIATLKKIINDYPRSAEASDARLLLKGT